MTTPLTRAEGIRLASVSKRFERKGFDRKGHAVQALDPIDLTIAEGEFVSIIGPSGSGKSTLLRMIAGLLPHDTGTITVGDLSPDQARREKHFGFLPQTPALLPWRTVAENVTLLGELNGGRHDRAIIEPENLLAEVGLAEFAHAHPAELSGGMQQRVALARTVSLGAPVLLMDEPFASLDEITRTEMRYLLLDVWRRTGATCVFVTHSIDEAVVLSDRVVVLSPRPGRIIHVEQIEIERPRRLGIEDQPQFHAHVSTIRRVLHENVQ